MIHFFYRSHAKKPESGHFSDWIGNNTDDLRCSDWPKRRHPLVVFDFSLHFCLRNEQWIHTRLRYKISAGSVFSNLKNAQIEISSIEIFSISSYTKICSKKFTDHLNAIWYRLQVTEATNGFAFQISNSWMESWPGLTVIPPSETCELFWASLRFHNTFQFVKYGASAYFFSHCFRQRTKSTSFNQ